MLNIIFTSKEFHFEHLMNLTKRVPAKKINSYIKLPWKKSFEINSYWVHSIIQRPLYLQNYPQWFTPKTPIIRQTLVISWQQHRAAIMMIWFWWHAGWTQLRKTRLVCVQRSEVCQKALLDYDNWWNYNHHDSCADHHISKRQVIGKCAINANERQVCSWHHRISVSSQPPPQSGWTTK